MGNGLSWPNLDTDSKSATYGKLINKNGQESEIPTVDHIEGVLSDSHIYCANKLTIDMLRLMHVRLDKIEKKVKKIG